MSKRTIVNYSCDACGVFIEKEIRHHTLDVTYGRDEVDGLIIGDSLDICGNCIANVLDAVLDNTSLEVRKVLLNKALEEAGLKMGIPQDLRKEGWHLP